MEKIKCATIKYRLKDSTQIRYVSGKSHAECISYFYELGLKTSQRDMSFEEQGFMTSNGRFVDRIEALKIAKESKQVADTYDKDILYSEFIDWSK